MLARYSRRWHVSDQSSSDQCAIDFTSDLANGYIRATPPRSLTAAVAAELQTPTAVTDVNEKSPFPMSDFWRSTLQSLSDIPLQSTDCSNVSVRFTRETY